LVTFLYQDKKVTGVRGNAPLNQDNTKRAKQRLLPEQNLFKRDFLRIIVFFLQVKIFSEEWNQA